VKITLVRAVRVAAALMPIGIRNASQDQLLD